ncbi:hypothetical protein Bca4012_041056 [Brassica carinata]
MWLHNCSKVKTGHINYTMSSKQAKIKLFIVLFLLLSIQNPNLNLTISPSIRVSYPLLFFFSNQLKIQRSFYEGSWCGCFWSGQNKIPIAAASKGNCEGALPKRWQRFKNKMEMISRRVLKETDFSCSDGIAQNKARSCFVCYIFFLLLL